VLVLRSLLDRLEGQWLRELAAVDGRGAALLAALAPLARPTTADDQRSGPQRQADAQTELARRALEGGRLPQTGGVRPQRTVTVELASLLAERGLPGGDGGWAGPLPAASCQRLACDAALTRAVVARRHGDGDPGGLAGRLRAAVARLPPPWAAPPPSRWTWDGPPGWSRPRSAGRWRSATAAAASPAATGRRPGVRPTICATGCMAAPPTWPTWCCCAAATIVPCTRAAGGSTGTPAGTSPRHRHTDDSPPRPEAGRGSGVDDGAGYSDGIRIQRIG
jgi:Domain of unknown function (DUF222)